MHRLNRDLLANATRDDDEGDIEAAGIKDRQCLQGIELRQVEVGKDELDSWIQLGPEGLLVVDAHPVGIDAAAAEFPQDELCVRVAVLDHQDAHAPCGHRQAALSTGALFNKSQPCPARGRRS